MINERDWLKHRIPVWDVTVPKGAELIEMPTDPDALQKYVRENSGVRVIGWRTEAEFERKPWDSSRESPVLAPK